LLILFSNKILLNILLFILKTKSFQLYFESTRLNLTIFLDENAANAIFSLLSGNITKHNKNISNNSNKIKNYAFL
jgi:hypothetical protein